MAGLAAAIGAFVIAGAAARIQLRGRDGVVLPVGLLLVASVAVVWDFSTSGLEMSLVWLWLAGSWWALMTARPHRSDPQTHPDRVLRHARPGAARAS